MTPTQQTSLVTCLSKIKIYLELTIAEATISDEDFVPELAGMAERVGVILSAVRAGFYTSTPTPTVTTGIRLTESSRSTPRYKGDSSCFKIVGSFHCCRCDKTLVIGDVVDNLTSNLKHISCERPQG